ncbi:hypothetical protein CCACVL1_03752 [Corchorus capsularis]|uniref:Uncharacterized protein n=1 Tax=Corchorus capsularis TaxID=210143 RepID=A0A1R3JXE2_COCAP|nr:hypothetical protein CCACVL1_03752 [Corchorus capsularis]
MANQNVFIARKKLLQQIDAS